MAASRPLPPIPWVRAAYYGVDDQKEFSLDFWWSVTNGVLKPGDDNAPAAAAIDTVITTNLAALFTADIKLKGFYLELSDGAIVIGSDTFTGSPGTEGSGGFLPADVAAVVQKITGFPGKSHRGRWYMPCVPEDFTSGSYLSILGSSTYIAQFNQMTAPVSFTGFLGAVTLTACHFAKKANTLDPITNIFTNAELGTKRRRRGAF